MEELEEQQVQSCGVTFCKASARVNTRFKQHTVQVNFLEAMLFWQLCMVEGEACGVNMSNQAMLVFHEICCERMSMEILEHINKL